MTKSCPLRSPLIDPARFKHETYGASEWREQYSFSGYEVALSSKRPDSDLFLPSGQFRSPGF